MSDLPKSYLTEDERAGLLENERYLDESDAAAKAGDMDTAWAWLRLAELPAHALMAAKNLNGADWIKQKGLRTETAEKRYGKDWLA